MIKNGKKENPIGLLTLLCGEKSPGTRGNKIELIVKGDLPKDILKKCSEELGGLFGIESEERPLSDVIYKRAYGHWPEEALERS